jgi:hypothetical protein
MKTRVACSIDLCTKKLVLSGLSDTTEGTLQTLAAPPSNILAEFKMYYAFKARQGRAVEFSKTIPDCNSIY